MTMIWPDRVLETTTGNGTGPFVTSGAVVGYQRLSEVDGIQVGDTFRGGIYAVDAATGQPSGDWVSGLLTYSDTNQVTVTTVSHSSNGDLEVDFPTGTKWIIACPTGADFASWVSALGGLPNYLEISTLLASERSGIDLTHYAGQGVTPVNAVNIHDYTDGSTTQWDKVGGDQASQQYIHNMRLANNAIRRPDKSGTYVGAAGFMQLTKDTFPQTAAVTASISGTVLTVTAVTSGALAVGSVVEGTTVLEGTVIDSLGTGTGGTGTYNLLVRGEPTAQTVSSRAMTGKTKTNLIQFYINNSGGLGWDLNPAILTTNKATGDAVYAHQRIATQETQNLWSLSGFNTAAGTVQQALAIQTTVSSTRVDLISSSAKTSGLRLETLAGGIDLAPITGRPVTIRNGAKLPSYTVAGLPAVGSFYPESIVYCSNGDAGSPCLAIASGGAWKGVTIGAAVSATNPIGPYLPLSGGTLTGDLIVPDEAYDATAWNGSLEVPTKNAVRDKIEAIVGGAGSASSTTQVLTGTDTSTYATPDALAALWEQGSDVASAGTISIGEGGHFHVTGTTTITDIDPATDKAGRFFTLTFDGVLTLTHNASTLILPTGANIVTAAGDTATFKSEGSDAVRCVSYQRANGQALAGGSAPTEVLMFACSDETTAITTGTAKLTFRMPYAFTLTAVRASVTTAPTGSTILIDINESGSTILSTKLMIDASEKTSTTATTPAVISDASLADDAEMTIDFDQVGSTIAGAGVKVYLIGHQ